MLVGVGKSCGFHINYSYYNYILECHNIKKSFIKLWFICFHNVFFEAMKFIEYKLNLLPRYRENPVASLVVSFILIFSYFGFIYLSTSLIFTSWRHKKFGKPLLAQIPRPTELRDMCVPYFPSIRIC